LAGKIDAILKLSVVASVLFASSSVRYYYLSYLPRRDARFEPERALEQLRTAGVPDHAGIGEIPVYRAEIQPTLR